MKKKGGLTAPLGLTSNSNAAPSGQLQLVLFSVVKNVGLQMEQRVLDTIFFFCVGGGGGGLCWSFRSPSVTDDAPVPVLPPSELVVHAGPLAVLDGHPADGGRGRQPGLGRELLHQDPQNRVHAPVHLVDLDATPPRRRRRKNKQTHKRVLASRKKTSGINILRTSSLRRSRWR